MNGPYHDFLLVNKEQHAPSQYMELINHPSCVKISDDLIWYMNDSLKWIPSDNLSQGLSMYGVTVIKAEGARKAEKILNAWISLFTQAPETITLTGQFFYMHGSTPDTGKYEKIKFPRDEIIESLSKISGFCRTVIESKDRYYLLHFGV